MKATAAGIIAAILLLSGTIGLARARDLAYPLPVVDDQQLYVTSPNAALRLSLEFRALAADLYWIRALQYYGGIQRGHKDGEPPALAKGRTEYDQLFPLLDLTTSFDPHFNLAYRFGAIFLSEPPPAGPGRPDLAIRLLEKGLAARPDKWEYMQDIGFVHYWWRHDYLAAATWFDKASRVPGAPWFLRSLSAVTLAEGGDRQASRTMWLAIRQSAEIDWLKEDADRRLEQLDVLDLIDGVQRTVDIARPRTGTLTTWPGLIRAGVLRGVPLDPAGVPLDIDSDGQVHLSVKSRLYPLPSQLQDTDRSRQP